MLGMKAVGYRLGIQDAQKMIHRKFHRKNSFYDALGITPKATQADIKKAFYKLSMQFHPDKSTGNDVKFKEISAAYEVLGNMKLRRLYDGGMFPAGDPSDHGQGHDNVNVYEPSEQYNNNAGEKRKREPMTGKTNTYNYDEWYRAHYAETFTRKDRNRVRWANQNAQRIINTTHSARTETVIWMFGCLVFSLLLYNNHMQRQWDKPRKKPETEET